MNKLNEQLGEAGWKALTIVITVAMSGQLIKLSLSIDDANMMLTFQYEFLISVNSGIEIL